MKKISKNKILLALLAVVLVSSMMLAGTYSWFVVTNEVGGATGSATLTAANIELSVTSDLSFVTKDLDVYCDLFPNDPLNANRPLSKDIWNTTLPLTTDLAPIDIDELTTNDFARGALMYPRDGVRFTLDGDLDITLVNNRDVVVEFDLSDLFASLEELRDKIKALAQSVAPGVNCDDIYFEYESFEVGADYAPGNGKFYLLVKANAGIDQIANDFIAGFQADFAIVGHAYNQNHYMDKSIPFSAQDLRKPTITVVQYTEQAIIDVFGQDVWDGLNKPPVDPDDPRVKKASEIEAAAQAKLDNGSRWVVPFAKLDMQTQLFPLPPVMYFTIEGVRFEAPQNLTGTGTFISTCGDYQAVIFNAGTVTFPTYRITVTVI